MDTVSERAREKFREAADKSLPAAVTGAARDAAITQLVKQSEEDYKKHLRVTHNSQYSFWTWDEEYEKPDDLQDAWSKVLVTRQQARIDVQIYADCLRLSVCLQDG